MSRGHGMCKCPEAGVHLLCWESTEQPRKTGEELGRDEARKLGRPQTVRDLEGHCNDLALILREIGTMRGF